LVFGTNKSEIYINKKMHDVILKINHQSSSDFLFLYLQNFKVIDSNKGYIQATFDGFEMLQLTKAWKKEGGNLFHQHKLVKNHFQNFVNDFHHQYHVYKESISELSIFKYNLDFTLQIIDELIMQSFLDKNYSPSEFVDYYAKLTGMKSEVKNNSEISYPEDTFSSELIRNNSAKGENGAVYKLHVNDRVITMERNFNDENIIVQGFNGIKFPSEEIAIIWASIDNSRAINTNTEKMLLKIDKN